MLGCCRYFLVVGLLFLIVCNKGKGMSISNDIVLTVDRDLEVPVDCGLLGGLYRRFRESRTELLNLLGKAQSLVPLAIELRQIFERSPGLDFKVIFPAGALEKLQQGVWSLKDAKDGSGILPTIFGNGGQFVKQVRLEPDRLRKIDPSAVANAAAHAQTHALLREVLAKLDVIDKKLDLQLAYDRAGWLGQIASGVEQYRAVVQEPGDTMNRAAVLATAQQSLSEGQRKGLLKLREYLTSRSEPVTSWWRQFLPFGNPKRNAPSLYHADTLDRVEADFKWCYAAARTKAAIHVDSGRPQAAAKEVLSLSEDFSDLAKACEVRYRFARYREQRRSFWEDQLPTLIVAPKRQRLPISIECTASELLNATEEKEKDAGK